MDFETRSIEVSISAEVNQATQRDWIPLDRTLHQNAVIDACVSPGI